MQPIPIVRFYKRIRQEFEFDVVSLTSLFAKMSEIKDHSIIQPHRVQFYMLLFITKGSGTHLVDLVPYPYEEGSLFIIAKGQVQAFQYNQSSDGYLLVFTEAFLQKYLQRPEHMPLHHLFNLHLYEPVLKAEEIKDRGISQIIKEIVREFEQSDEFGKEELLHSLLKALLLKIERMTRKGFVGAGQSRWMSKFAVFKQRVEEGYVHSRNASDYAAVMDISARHLSRICQAITGMTAKEFIDQYVILEMKRMLATSNISIKDLADAMGFDEDTNLVKFFKKHTHCTPTRFKKDLLR